VGGHGVCLLWQTAVIQRLEFVHWLEVGGYETSAFAGSDQWPMTCQSFRAMRCQDGPQPHDDPGYNVRRALPIAAGQVPVPVGAGYRGVDYGRATIGKISAHRVWITIKG
jgi:hypothetical protein